MWGAIFVAIVSFLALLATFRPYAPKSLIEDEHKLRFRWPR